MINPLSGFTYVGPVAFAITVNASAAADYTITVPGLAVGDLVSVVRGKEAQDTPLITGIVVKSVTIANTLVLTVNVSGATNVTETWYAIVSRPENNPIPTTLQV